MARSPTANALAAATSGSTAKPTPTGEPRPSGYHSSDDYDPANHSRPQRAQPPASPKTWRPRRHGLPESPTDQARRRPAPVTRELSDANDGLGTTEAAVVRPLERAQLVWRRAIVLARSEQPSHRFVASLDLLRTAQHGPSTMLHALGLGRTQQQAAPDDIPTRDAVRLLTHTISWLGRPTDADEVGAARSQR